jgi:hypothetical protein
MGVLSLFNTTGYIFGPAIVLTGLLALLLCLRASSWARNRPARRVALVASLMPFAAGVCGALIGLAMWWYADKPATDNGAPWFALGKACLAGLVVTAIPLVWSSLLLRAQRRVA